MDWTGYRQTLVIILAQATGDGGVRGRWGSNPRSVDNGKESWAPLKLFPDISESRRQFGLTGKVEFLFIAFYVGRVGLEPTTGGL